MDSALTSEDWQALNAWLEAVDAPFSAESDPQSLVAALVTALQKDNNMATLDLGLICRAIDQAVAAGGDLGVAGGKSDVNFLYAMITAQQQDVALHIIATYPVDPHQRFDGGKTYAHLLMEHCCARLFRPLYALGLDVNLPNDAGEYPSRQAQDGQNGRLVEWAELQQCGLRLEGEQLDQFLDASASAFKDSTREKLFRDAFRLNPELTPDHVLKVLSGSKLGHLEMMWKMLLQGARPVRVLEPAEALKAFCSAAADRNNYDELLDEARRQIASTDPLRAEYIGEPAATPGFGAMMRLISLCFKMAHAAGDERSNELFSNQVSPEDKGWPLFRAWIAETPLGPKDTPFEALKALEIDEAGYEMVRFLDAFTQLVVVPVLARRVWEKHCVEHEITDPFAPELRQEYENTLQHLFASDDDASSALWSLRMEKILNMLRPQVARMLFGTHRNLLDVVDIMYAWRDNAADIENLKCFQPTGEITPLIDGAVEFLDLDRRLVALRSRQDVLDEAEAMEHCIAKYVGRVLSGNQYVFSIQDMAGNHVATLGLVPYEIGTIHSYYSRLYEAEPSDYPKGLGVILGDTFAAKSHGLPSYSDHLAARRFMELLALPPEERPFALNTVRDELVRVGDGVQNREDINKILLDIGFDPVFRHPEHFPAVLAALAGDNFAPPARDKQGNVRMRENGQPVRRDKTHLLPGSLRKAAKACGAAQDSQAAVEAFLHVVVNGVSVSSMVDGVLAEVEKALNPSPPELAFVDSTPRFACAESRLGQVLNVPVSLASKVLETLSNVASHLHR